MNPPEGYHSHLVLVGSRFWEYLRACPELKRDLAPGSTDINTCASVGIGLSVTREAAARRWRAGREEQTGTGTT